MLNGNSVVLRVRLLNRALDLFSDACVVALLLIAVKVGVLPPAMSTAAIGFAFRSLVHPSLSFGVFTRTWPTDQDLKHKEEPTP